VHVARIEDRISVFCWGDPREENQLEDLGVDGRIILTRILKRCDGGAWTGLMWRRVWTGCGRFLMQ
jgi:hypothetical protein